MRSDFSLNYPFQTSVSPILYLFLFLFNLTYRRWIVITILPVVTKDFLISRRFTYRDASSALLQLVNQWLNFTYLLTFPRFPLRKKEHKSYIISKNRTHDFRTSRCADYLLDHSGDEATTACNKRQLSGPEPDEVTNICFNTLYGFCVLDAACPLLPIGCEATFSDDVGEFYLHLFLFAFSFFFVKRSICW